MKCPVCSNEISETAKFCPYCGLNMTDETISPDESNTATAETVKDAESVSNEVKNEESVEENQLEVTSTEQSDDADAVILTDETQTQETEANINQSNPEPDSTPAQPEKAQIHDVKPKAPVKLTQPEEANEELEISGGAKKKDVGMILSIVGVAIVVILAILIVVMLITRKDRNHETELDGGNVIPTQDITSSLVPETTMPIETELLTEAPTQAPEVTETPNGSGSEVIPTLTLNPVVTEAVTSPLPTENQGLSGVHYMRGSAPQPVVIDDSARVLNSSEIMSVYADVMNAAKSSGYAIVVVLTYDTGELSDKDFIDSYFSREAGDTADGIAIIINVQKSTFAIELQNGAEAESDNLFSDALHMQVTSLVGNADYAGAVSLIMQAVEK